MSINQLVARAAQLNPHSIAIDHDGIQLNWAAFVQRVACRAQALLQHGLQAGDRVAVLAANVPEHMEASLGVLWAGLTLVPVNTRLTLAEQAYILQHADCRVLLHDACHADQAGELQRAEQIDLISLAPIAQWGTASDPLASLAPLPLLNLPADTRAALFYTGGTTGQPKGVELSHNALMLQGLNAKDGYRLDDDTVYMHTAPMFHLADFAAALGATTAAGRHLFLTDFSADAILDAIQQRGVNIIVMVPTMIACLLDAAQQRPGALDNLRTMLYGAAPIAEPLLRRLLTEAPKVGLIQVYGQTEVGGGCTLLPPSYHVLEGAQAGKLNSAGRPTPGFLFRIVDELGNPQPCGVSGEICISGPGLMTSYWKSPELTEAALQDGWIRTGDLGVLDEHGFVTVVGRLKDMIISGGENIFAGEVENALMYHPAVEAAAVIGVPNEKWGEAVHAAVVLREGHSVSVDELIAHCRQRIAPYKCPRSIELRREPLPVSGVGKVRKVDIRAEWERAQHQGS